MRRRSSELYQVDFVAALFGGFLLVWLASIGESEFPGTGDGKGIGLFEIKAKATFKGVDNDLETTVDVIAHSGFQAGCAHPDLLEKIERAGLVNFPCKAESANRLSAASVGNGTLVDRAITQAKMDGMTRLNSLGGSFAPHFEVRFDTTSGEKAGIMAGAMFKPTGDWFQTLQLGVLPPDAASSAPPSVHISDWTRRGLWMALSDGTAPALDTDTPIDVWYVEPADDVSVETDGQLYGPRILRMEITLTVVRDGSPSCWKGTIESGVEEKELVRC